MNNIEIIYWFVDLMFWFAVILTPFAILELFILHKQKDNKTEIELWEIGYQKDVPTVWNKL